MFHKSDRITGLNSPDLPLINPLAGGLSIGVAVASDNDLITHRSGNDDFTMTQNVVYDQLANHVKFTGCDKRPGIKDEFVHGF